MLVSSIIEACLRILEQHGDQALTTNRIAEMAGVGIASIYQYFPNKDAIVAATFDALLERERAAVEREVEHESLRDPRRAIARVIGDAIALRRRLRRLSPEFYRKYNREFQLAARFGGGSPEEGVRRTMAAAGEMFAVFGAKLRVPNTALIQFLATRGLGAMIDRVVEEQPQLLDDPALQAALTELMVRFLLRTRTRP